MLGCKHKIADRFFRRPNSSNPIKAFPAVIIKTFAYLKRHEGAFRLKDSHGFMVTRDVAKNEFV